MLYFPKWKIGLIVAATLIGLFYSLPNVIVPLTKKELPTWWQPVNLGLDLQGGAHLLLEVGVDQVVNEQLIGLVESSRDALRNARIAYRDLGVVGQTVRVRVSDPSARDQARQVLGDLDRAVRVGSADGDSEVLELSYSEQWMKDRQVAAVGQSIEIVRRRVDELGTREPVIQKQGENRIVVEIPGLDDPERVKRLIGKTAKLTFHLVDNKASLQDALRGKIPPGDRLLPSASANDAGQYLIRRAVEVGGDRLVDAAPTFQDNRAVVSFKFDSAGGKKFGETTKNNVGRQLAIVLDEKVISAPVIREPILGGSGTISGSFSTQEAQDLALLLRAGALPAPLTILEERTVGPGLGADSIQAGAMACAIGVGLVVVFMIAAYRTFGLFANVAVIANVVMLIGALSLIGATLTLPGIAGIVLTVGMAVDANVLIYERMREEARRGRTALNAAEAGFKGAFATILDSNLTTLVSGLLMFQFGTGPVRGFAVTLCLGIATTLFTAIMVTRMLVVFWLRRNKPDVLPISTPTREVSK